MKTRILRGVLITATVFATIVQAQIFSRADEQSVRDLIKVFGDTRNTHDGRAVAAFYSENGEWISENGITFARGRTDLASMWARVTGRVERTIQSVNFPAPNIAVVRVATQYEDIGRHNEVFVLVKDLGKSLIQIHQTVD